jgi:serine/threonine protein kinase
MINCEQYAPYFVRTFGWFENAKSVFITMEYYSLGDLHGFKKSSPPFSEVATSQIVRQLISGVHFMHESGFAHRDLKPGVSVPPHNTLSCFEISDPLGTPHSQNILIASTSPWWQVKIADFGISKQVAEGTARTRTMAGTMGYMAPEVLGFFANNNPAMAYTVSADIWAVGIIALELLLKRHPLPQISDLVSYKDGVTTLDFRRDPGGGLTEICQDFVSGLLAPDPVIRPTALAALAHPWLAGTVDPAGLGDTCVPQAFFYLVDLFQI